MYRCTACWSQYPKWSWRCLNCSAWNSLEEFIESNGSGKNKISKTWVKSDIFELSDSVLNTPKVSLKSEELNLVLWWGLTNWSLTLLSWEPWIWKSTLSIQIADWYASWKNSVLYISAEENIQQISERAKRLWIKNNLIRISNASRLEDIISTLEDDWSWLVIIDSVSMIYSEALDSSPGSIWQIRYVAERLMEFSKNSQRSIIIIWHVTKDWSISWPKVLEHLVDTVLFLEWSKYESYRLLRSLKNRFWPTDEVWLFQMTELWLEDIKNPWLEFISESWWNANWSAIAMTMEWSRPILVEIEALTTYTKFWYPKRSARWIPSWKLDLLLAVITKFTDTKLDSYDVYLNVSRWLSINEPGADMAAIAAIISSKKWKPLWKTVFIWEVSLTWNTKNVIWLQKRVDEAIKLWFENIIIPETKNPIKSKSAKSKIICISKIQDISKII